MSENKNIRDELNELAPRMAKMEKSNPFVIPEKYFEHLPGIIQSRISKPKKTILNLEGLIQFLLKPQYSFSLAILTIAVIFGMKYFVGNNYQPALDKVSTETLNNYIQDNLSDFNEEIFDYYCCVEMNSSDYLFQNENEQDNYLNNYLINQIKEEDIL